MAIIRCSAKLDGPVRELVEPGEPRDVAGAILIVGSLDLHKVCREKRETLIMLGYARVRSIVLRFPRGEEAPDVVVRQVGVT